MATLSHALAVRGATVGRVGDIQLTVADLDREVAFFTNVLAFREIHRDRESGPEVDALTGLRGAQVRHTRLQLGNEVIRLTSFEAPKGRPIPADSRSHDHWFQHIAIVVSDMDRAYEQLRHHNVRHVSTGPQTLPAWNPNAGGIRAFYFRDPEDHVLEVIWFPAGKGNPKWKAAAIRTPDATFLGIDHTAIVVSDTERSLKIYRDRLGLRVAGESENHGVEQEHLNQLFGARLRITGLRAAFGPGIEFLEYIAPPGGRPLPADAKASDLVSWVIHLHGPTVSTVATEPLLRQVSNPPVSESAPARVLVRDPDGHLLQLDSLDAAGDSGS